MISLSLYIYISNCIDFFPSAKSKTMLAYCRSLETNYCTMLELSASIKRLVKIGPRRLGLTRECLGSPRATSLLRFRIWAVSLTFFSARLMSSASISSYVCGGNSFRLSSLDDVCLCRWDACPLAVLFMCDLGFSGVALLLY